MSDLFEPQIESGALISDCGRYRYYLWRKWSDVLPLLTFVMLNPSTADASEDDPTIRRCMGFARREGYGGILVVNLFALRATDPNELLIQHDPFGPDNAEHLSATMRNQPRIVCAWGSHKAAAEREAWFRSYYQNFPLWCLGTTKSGSPRHPLYLKKDAPLERWGHQH